MLLDTGAYTVSFIRTQDVRLLGLYGKMEHSSAVFEGGGGGFSAIGRVKVPFKLGGERVDVDMTVADEIPVSIVWGMDVLRDLQADVNVSKGVAVFEKLDVEVQLRRLGESANFGAILVGKELGVEEVQKLDAMEDISVEEAEQALETLLQKYASVFDEPTGALLTPIKLELREGCVRLLMLLTGFLLLKRRLLMS